MITIKKLKKEIENLPDDMQVILNLDEYKLDSHPLYKLDVELYYPFSIFKGYIVHNIDKKSFMKGMKIDENSVKEVLSLYSI